MNPVEGLGIGALVGLLTQPLRASAVNSAWRYPLFLAAALVAAWLVGDAPFGSKAYFIDALVAFSGAVTGSSITNTAASTTGVMAERN